MRPVRALLLDAGGTLLRVARPVPETYAAFARQHGHEVSVEDVQRGFRRAFSAPWPGRRYEGDGSPFWRHVVFEATGVRDEALFAELYAHYRDPEAWIIAPGGRELLATCRERGVRTALVSNWDTRLRPLLDALDLLELLDAVAISAEVGAEKPDPELVRAALQDLDVAPGEAVLVGDSDDDTRAGEAAGVQVWRMPGDVVDFDAVGTRLRLRQH